MPFDSPSAALDDRLPGPAALVAGGSGQLGFELSRLLDARGSLVHAPGSAELDVTDPQSVSVAVAGFARAARESGMRPVVINAAAYTAVDAAESEPERAAEVNARGAERIAETCAAHDIPLLHVSTDYVFSGTATTPYEPSDAADPRTVYGRTKLDGERAVLTASAKAWVVRTAWVYGATGSNFVKTMARLESERSELSVVDDQVGTPTWAADLAAGLVELAGRVTAGPAPGRHVLHHTNSGHTSWFGFAREIFTELGADPGRIRPCSSDEFPRPAPRPACSMLSGATWAEEGLTPARPWREALAAAFAADGPSLRAAANH